MIPAAAAGNTLDLAGLKALRGLAGRDDPRALQAAARQFEALFLQMMLKGMRAASFGDPLFGSSQMELYRDLADRQVALDLAGRTGLGLSELLARQLGGRAGAAPPTPTPTAVPRAAVSAPPETTAAPADLDGTPEGFVRALWPQAQAAARDLGVAPEFLLAQAALETGWGRAVIRHADGRSSHNLFGIKAGPGWRGETVATGSLEYRDGVMVRERSAFRAYGSWAESFQDYVEFLRTNPRYREALTHAGDPHAFAGALQAAGYATDPAYADKIRSILAGGRFHRLVAAARGTAPVAT